MNEPISINLRHWATNDLPLMERLMGDPVMTKHVGGPETPEKLRERLSWYSQDSSLSKIHMFVIMLGNDETAVGSTGYWEKTWKGETIWETGWRILPEFQGRGIATKAISLILELARSEKKYRFLHAFPSIDNAPSNAICKKMGFILKEEIDFEYPPGNLMRSNDWYFDLEG